MDFFVVGKRVVIADRSQPQPGAVRRPRQREVSGEPRCGHGGRGETAGGVWWRES